MSSHEIHAKALLGGTTSTAICEHWLTENTNGGHSFLDLCLPTILVLCADNKRDLPKMVRAHEKGRSL